MFNNEPRSIDDPFGAFCAGPRVQRAGCPGGPLSGLKFAVKDLFDIEGETTGAGNPDWAASHAPATATASAVRLLLEAGGTLLSKTRTDELAYSLMGRNIHHGTPINPAAPGHLTGGSSSGSAAAVAGGLVDFALGTDTGGSVRLPASFCGIFGFRPSHGRIALDGVVPLAPSFDTVGWFARDSGVLRKVGSVFGLMAPPPSPTSRDCLSDRGAASARLLLGEDAFTAAGGDVSQALAPAITRLEAILGTAESVVIAPDGLAEWSHAFSICQAAEAWAVHGAWITARQPAFGPGIAERFAAASRLRGETIAGALKVRRMAADRLRALLADGGILCLPTAPGAAPLRIAQPDEEASYRARALQLLCPAGLAGLPQVSIPVATLAGAPVGLSLITAAGADARLLAVLGVFAEGASRC